MAGLFQKYFQDEGSTRERLGRLLWKDGPVCPHCGVIEGSTKLRRMPDLKNDPKNGTKTHGRKGLYQCNGCRAQFTVTVNTIFEDSHHLRSFPMERVTSKAIKPILKQHIGPMLRQVAVVSPWQTQHRTALPNALPSAYAPSRRQDPHPATRRRSVASRASGEADQRYAQARGNREEENSKEGCKETWLTLAG